MEAERLHGSGLRRQSHGLVEVDEEGRVPYSLFFLPFEKEEEGLRDDCSHWRWWAADDDGEVEEEEGSDWLRINLRYRSLFSLPFDVEEDIGGRDGDSTSSNRWSRVEGLIEG